MTSNLIDDHGSAARSGCRLLVTSTGIKRIPTLPALLADFNLIFSKSIPSVGVDGVLAWGRRPSALKAKLIADRAKLPFITVEDGFVRSVGLGSEDPPLSLIVDDIGVYYDATTSSRLERMVPQKLDEADVARARALRDLWCSCRVSKYNAAAHPFNPSSTSFVLVVDQTAGDASISAGQAGQEAFDAMLSAALHDHPHSKILVKVHPEVIVGRKRGHYDLHTLAATPRVEVLADDVHMADVLMHAASVYVVTSQVGFEALLWGKNVNVFGVPFYAGWGLTNDHGPRPERRGSATLEQLVNATLIQYPRYVDPETGQRCSAETVIRWIGVQRSHRYRTRATAIGFSRWKKPFVRDFLGCSDVKFVPRPKRVPAGSTAVVWGCKHDEALVQCANVSAVLRIEDGFLRSVGLGADLIRPLSWVLDPTGIYYDARRPSALETLFRTYVFQQGDCARAAALRLRIVRSKITKYNLSGSDNWVRPDAAKHVILVPGQVESDASIRYGNGGITRNVELLTAVRRDNPTAYILYKPHPDVVAGLRERGEGEGCVLDVCDEVVRDVSMASLFDNVDEVNVLTSLAGFEALLRGKRVVTYGQPFYAGWGLTDDRRLGQDTLVRRGRKLTLDELVFTTLVLYPTYVSRVTRRFTTPERVLDELEAWRIEAPSMPSWRRVISRLFKKK